MADVVVSCASPRSCGSRGRSPSISKHQAAGDGPPFRNIKWRVMACLEGERPREPFAQGRAHGDATGPPPTLAVSGPQTSKSQFGRLSDAGRHGGRPSIIENKGYSNRNRVRVHVRVRVRATCSIFTVSRNKPTPARTDPTAEADRLRPRASRSRTRCVRSDWAAPPSPTTASPF